MSHSLFLDFWVAVDRGQFSSVENWWRSATKGGWPSVWKTECAWRWNEDLSGRTQCKGWKQLWNLGNCVLCVIWFLQGSWRSSWHEVHSARKVSSVIFLVDGHCWGGSSEKGNSSTWKNSGNSSSFQAVCTEIFFCSLIYTSPVQWIFHYLLLLQVFSVCIHVTRVLWQQCGLRLCLNSYLG